MRVLFAVIAATVLLLFLVQMGSSARVWPNPSRCVPVTASLSNVTIVPLTVTRGSMQQLSGAALDAQGNSWIATLGHLLALNLNTNQFFANISVGSGLFESASIDSNSHAYSVWLSSPSDPAQRFVMYEANPIGASWFANLTISGSVNSAISAKSLVSEYSQSTVFALVRYCTNNGCTDKGNSLTLFAYSSATHTVQWSQPIPNSLASAGYDLWDGPNGVYVFSGGTLSLISLTGSITWTVNKVSTDSLRTLMSPLLRLAFYLS
jgi:hypothetical protein